MISLGRVAVTLSLAAFCTAALPCGHCVEDKVAAVYDHAELMRAEAAHHHVAFCAVEGNLPADENAQRNIARTVEAIAGVDRGSMRMSVENTALAFTFDPSRISVDKAVRAMNRKVAALGFRLEPIRVMERTAELKKVEAASPGRRP
ncbi:hypothetical protein [Noviherbaspirillum sp.]|uniref:hypothetical protein n=1 Tax=Noviherbaspirillum sp. TaxID=1926288 RepID=UPI002B4704E0|nr:hypothetical protein [Noviherbaspirillum sp.]HJV83201.1 hypothetical protein [Noviherbaspirillum sp.]